MVDVLLNFSTAHVWLRYVLVAVLGILLWTVTSMLLCKRSQRICDEMELEISQHYFCGHNLADMIKTNFFGRFSDFNKEGFCYTYSAVIMLALRKFKHTRVVRGYIDQPDYQSNHSWVEIRICGRWWVIDLANQYDISMPQKLYYKVTKPEIRVIYTYEEFWRDPFAEKFQQRLRQPATSLIFWELFHRYTPYDSDESLRFKELDPSEIELFDPPYYMLSPPELGWKYSQRIVNEMMARPSRRTPKRRTLRRLDSLYRQIERTIACTSATESSA